MKKKTIVLFLTTHLTNLHNLNIWIKRIFPQLHGFYYIGILGGKCTKL